MIFLITGTSKGIGRMLVEHYCLDKSNFVFGCSRSSLSLDKENYFHFELDVTDEKAVVSLFKTIKKLKGGLDVLINNAGIAELNHSLLTTTESVEKLFNTNFLGAFLFSRESYKLLRKSKKGRIINLSTVAVPLDLSGNMVYAASKSAVESMTRIMSKELSESGITVNAVGPGPIKTRLVRSIPKEKIDDLISTQSVKRYTEIEDIINVIDFFRSEKSDFISGQIIYLGGIIR